MTNPKLKARLLPLSGKHYGTKVAVSLDGRSVGTIEIWLNRHDVYAQLSDSSERELSTSDYTSVEEARQDGFPCDCHYESVLDYAVATAITDILDGLEIPTQLP
jgi:hypothetical protein